jgi:hypothetical protein
MYLNLLNYSESETKLKGLAVHKYFFTFLVAIAFMAGLQTKALAQQPKVKGGFLADSMQVGEIKAYSLTATYPSQLQVVFPDSLYNYQSFELVDKQWFATRTDSLISFDSAVYYVRSFEVDTVQYLSLPVFVVEKDDSVAFYAKADSLLFKHAVSTIPDSLALQAHTEFLPVEKDFNYWYFGLILIGIVVLVVLIVVLFGKKIIVAYKNYRLSSKHKRFVREFDAYIQRVKNTPELGPTEAGLVYWKQYMEKLLERPYTKSTSREILGMESDADLSASLQAIDRSIYGGFRDEQLYQNFELLRNFADRKYQTKKEEIKND